MKKVSFVIPCYCSTLTIGKVVAEIEDKMKTMPQYSHEIILVNDCSPDDTFETIKNLASDNPIITGLSLAKNFGQHAALMAGFKYVSGDIVVCLDDDGQTPADEVDRLLVKIEEGYDVAYARYPKKKQSAFRVFGSKVNDKMANSMLGKPKELAVTSYFAAARFVIDEMMSYTNPYPYVIGLVLRTTKNIVNVDIEQREREIGHSGYNFGKLIALWFNGFTAFSVKPLRIATASGAVCAIVGFLYGIYTIIKKFVLGSGVEVGFSALMSFLVFIGGIIMLMLGIIGEYIGRIYISMNNSPQFVVRECVGEHAAK